MIKKEPAMTVMPEKSIMPVYDPCPDIRSTPAIGPPTRALQEGREHGVSIDAPSKLGKTLTGMK